MPADNGLPGWAENGVFSAMRYLKTNEAAALLNVGPSTLRAWERRFGFPRPQRSPGGHRAYPHGELAALRAALEEGHSISAAVARARAALAADTSTLIAALLAYDHECADRAIETTLALRSVERSVDEVLLPGLEKIAGRMGADSAAWAFSAGWAADWLRRAKRLAPPSVGRTSIMLVNASRDELDLDAVYIRALKVFCMRAGIKVLNLSAQAMNGIGDVASVHRPDLIVLAGQEMDETTIARWTNAIARSNGRSGHGRLRSTATRRRRPITPSSPPRQAMRKLRLLELAHPAHLGHVRRLAS